MKTKNQNLFSIFRQAFPEDLNNPLLSTPDGTVYSYEDALEESARIALCLSELGLRPGDRVTAQVEKSPMAVWLYLACLRGGFVFHPLNTDYQLDELVYFVDNAAPSLVVCDPAREQLFRELAKGKDFRVLTLDAAGRGQLNDAIQEVPPAFETQPRKASDTAVLLYSSGTTGVPKGAMLSHGNLAANTATLVDYWGFSPTDVLLHALPVYHAHGLFVAIGCALLSGSSMIFLPRFDRDTVLQQLPQATVMMGVPTFYTRLLADQRFDRNVCRNMRLFISGSAPLQPETFAAFQERSGHTILERYGMTETSMNASNPLNGERRPGSVGPALPGVSLRVVDDQGKELASGEVGHLQVKGPNVFSGYWRMREKTAEEFTGDGFFKTGDEALIDADGYVTIVGRAKDLVITGGLNVYPREVETMLDSLPEVQESAVIGAPHPDFGEGVIAIVVARQGQDVSGTVLIDQIRSGMAAYKLPKRVFAVTDLPRNSMGKVQKNLLRDQYAGTFSADQNGPDKGCFEPPL
jgi:malonyl-CoA/methylmalonyl-CoA synthetase